MIDWYERIFNQNCIHSNKLQEHIFNPHLSTRKLIGYSHTLVFCFAREMDEGGGGGGGGEGRVL